MLIRFNQRHMVGERSLYAGDTVHADEVGGSEVARKLVEDGKAEEHMLLVMEHGQSPYNAGERASFPALKARELIAKKLARPVYAEKQDVATVQQKRK